MTVSMQGYIREMHAGGFSTREVSQRPGAGRNTVAKHLAKQDFSPPPSAARGPAPPPLENPPDQGAHLGPALPAENLPPVLGYPYHVARAIPPGV